ncbi:hypothetical protein [Paracidovorax wautersii]|uniref:hypothetical protein n=1 Tax=Paracidovorax wautersii TaxID=1177982 RepID=UPI0031D8D593
MPAIETSSESIEPSTAPSAGRIWVMAIGGVVIAVQLAALGMVLNGQVEQASARQAAQASPRASGVQVTSTAELRPASLTQ